MSSLDKAASSKAGSGGQETDVQKQDITHLGQAEVAYAFNQRSWWTRVPFTTTKPPPPPQYTITESPLIPEATASLLSLITFGWITPLLGLGYARPLVAADLWKLQDNRSAEYIAAKINASFDRRLKEAAEYNKRLANGEVKPGLKKVWWTLAPGSAAEKERRWRETDGKKRASLVWAMNDSVAWWFWSGGLLKVVGDVAQCTSPLVVKAIITFATESYAGRQTGAVAVPGMGVGIGLTFGLLAMQIVTSLCINHFFYRSTSSGVLLRGGLITAIYQRSLRLTSRARSTLTNGKLVNHISTDVSRIDFCAGFFHMAWTAFVQLGICLALLLVQLGPSALAGFAFFVVATPIQTYVMKRLFALRRRSMIWTDKRVKMLQELLGGMKIIKYFAWEVPFLNRIEGYRRNEMAFIRSLLLIRSAMNAVTMSMPAVACVLTFVTYAATGNELEPAVIFTSLTLFNLLRLPLLFLPMSLSSIADAAQATSRLYGVFEAELLEETIEIDETLEAAVEIKNATFTWDAPPPDKDDDGGKGKKNKEGKKAPGKRSKKDVEATKEGNSPPAEDEKPFAVKDINMTIPRGKLVALVGSVGSGKTSLLQGMIGEMRRTAGSVKFGGSVGYCAQSSWIQNATIRENICFGRPFEEERYWKAVKDSCLGPDLDMFEYGDMTEVGEKGISLSGGQKQRVNICRAIYCNTDIQIFDDPLSALDAHVGKSVFQNVLQSSAPGKTRILVTHALHFLPFVDYIFVVSDGRVVERGTYTELMDHGRDFARFVSEFGNNEEEEKTEGEVEAEAIKGAAEAASKLLSNPLSAATVQPSASSTDDEKGAAKAEKTVAPRKGLMQEEERNTGAILWGVYASYFKAGRGGLTLPLLFLSLTLIQAATVLSSYWLVWWQEREWGQTNQFYMIIYAALGVSQALFAFVMGACFALLTYFASQSLHKSAITRVMHAPMLFFETTPLGRIMNRFSKDIDTVDNLLSDSMRMFSNTFCAIIGAIIIISIILPWFLIAVVVIMFLYIWAAAFYRSSARELKRLDAVLRSSLYTHFSESLSGLTTIRAYGESQRFILDNQSRVDVENRAYWLTVTNQRWLGIRLDFLGAMLTFVVAILTVGTRFTISPAQTGLVLSYILSVQQAFGWLVRQTAEVENNMNSVERVDHYATHIEQEAPHHIEERKPSVEWPKEGRVELRDVVLSYRPGLPPVLKGLTMSVKAGEKIGIVGRTGAGKSSVMTALYRLVELSSGSIIIDDVDIASIGLFDLRSRLAIIPQDPLLFSGTLRSNLDPFNEQEDAVLWDALKRSYLVSDSPARARAGSITDSTTGAGSGAQTPVNRFTLDTVIEDEGANLSIGQRSLVSLARALVKNSKIIILDEATASVDYETDRNIQDTITYEFKDRTVLCIAHRLRTIISYDRICVLDAGQIAEFDTPEKLFLQPDGIFRGMCERSSITLEDIRNADATAHERAQLHGHSRTVVAGAV